MICVCGHSEQEHFRETGSCLHSTEEVVWACMCHEFRKRVT